MHNQGNRGPIQAYPGEIKMNSRIRRREMLASTAGLGATLLAGTRASQAATSRQDLAQPHWVRKVYSNGRGWHVGNMVKWKGTYYICFVDGTGHGSEDSQIRVSSSTDLKNWTSQIVTGRTHIDPQLLPVGDKLLVYAVKIDVQKKTDSGSPSWEVMASTRDGKNWSQPKRCFLMNNDFWHPVEHRGRYYITCDNAGHVPSGSNCKVDLLTSVDGERWTWVSEIIHGSDQPGDEKTPSEHWPYFDEMNKVYFGTRRPSETALCFLDDGRLLAITRAIGYMACISIADPPFTDWNRYPRRLSHTSRCYGAAIQRVGKHIVVTGRYQADQNPDGSLGIKGAATGVFLYKDGDINLHALLPSGSDTGYAGILPYTENEALIAYYSSHEHSPNPGSNVYLASVPLA